MDEYGDITVIITDKWWLVGECSGLYYPIDWELFHNPIEESVGDPSAEDLNDFP